MAQPNGINGALKRPLTLGNAMALVGFLAALSAIITFALPPLVKSAFSDFADAKGYVSREELKLLVLERLDTLATREQIQSLQARLDRMDTRLRELEKPK